MALDSRALAWATLAHKALPQRGLVTLLREFRDPAVILSASAATLGRHVPAAVAAAALAPVPAADLDATRRWLDDPSHHLIAWDDGDYPRALLDIGHAPPVLFFIGARPLLNVPALAIVGSRMATPQGRTNARGFARALADAGLTIVSGLAHGVDAAAHEGALPTAASTLAVIGTGPDRVYPARNRDLARRIAERGGIVSEFLPGTPPRKENFPRRNRLISGLARVTVVVEAAQASGALQTAGCAQEQGREVMAVPGPITSPVSAGTNGLIRDGATPLLELADLLPHYPEAAPIAVRGPAPEAGTLAPVEGRIVNALWAGPRRTEELIEATGAPVTDALDALSALELSGRIRQRGGGLYELAPTQLFGVRRET